MAVTRKEFAANTVLTAAEVNVVQDNGVIQVGSEEEMEALPETVKICYRTDKTETWMMLGVTWTRMATTNDVTTINKRLIPIGSIMMWSDANGGIPAGWAECNGQTANGIKTQDMRGMVPVGANPGNVGNGDQVVLNQEVGHSKGEFRMAENQSYHRGDSGAIWNDWRAGYGSAHYVTATNASNWHGHHIPVRAQHTGGSSRPTAWMYDNNRSSSGASDGNAGAVNHNHVGYFRGQGAVGASVNVNVNQRGRGVYFVMYVGGN